MAGKIFISYRRSENPKDALLVFKHLAAAFSPDRVFMDIDGIRPGDDFVEVLEQQLDECAVLLALIGPDWLHSRNEHGERKLDDEHDFVRVEIRAALERQVRVVPLLLDGAPMPRVADLPSDLHLLVRRQGLKVDATDMHAFRSAMDRLLDVVRAALEAPHAPAPTAPETPSISTPVRPSRPAWMHDQGQDAHGRWADLRINNVTQRMRWIEPGEFWMGSTEAERKRFSEGASDDFTKWIQNEQPRHRVQITQGFWLANTACTQALWQTLVGDNPSHFTGDLQLPVEQISWDDITQKFLPALNQRLRGAQATLPTEAEWEYACRAGTETAYSFGELITPEQVNFDGNHPPPGGKKGLYRERTVPVSALPLNAWGLYQMHGNVWEWCEDKYGAYTAREEKDPTGPQDGARRVLRGGSWTYGARSCRSARRNADDPDLRNNLIGFRLALRVS